MQRMYKLYVKMQWECAGTIRIPIHYTKFNFKGSSIVISMILHKQNKFNVKYLAHLEGKPLLFGFGNYVHM